MLGENRKIALVQSLSDTLKIFAWVGLILLGIVGDILLTIFIVTSLQLEVWWGYVIGVSIAIGVLMVVFWYEAYKSILEN